jgi:hypothetical protein
MCIAPFMCLGFCLKCPKAASACWSFSEDIPPAIYSKIMKDENTSFLSSDTKVFATNAHVVPPPVLFQAYLLWLRDRSFRATRFFRCSKLKLTILHVPSWSLVVLDTLPWIHVEETSNTESGYVAVEDENSYE